MYCFIFVILYSTLKEQLIDITFAKKFDKMKLSYNEIWASIVFLPTQSFKLNYLFRELPALAKQLIVRLLYIEQSIPQAVVSSWVSHQYQSHSKKTQETLTSLRVSRYLNIIRIYFSILLISLNLLFNIHSQFKCLLLKESADNLCRPLLRNR